MTPRTRTYILVDKEPVPEPDMVKWGEFWRDREQWRVAQTEIPGGLVSTVFLGVDHRFIGEGPPLLFETMTFIDGESVNCGRTSTWTEAEAMHNAVAAELVAELLRRKAKDD